MKKLIHDWFTEPNNQTYCLIKALTASGALVFFACALIHVIANKSFDFSAFGVGLGSIIAGSGAGLAMKKDTT